MECISIFLPFCVVFATVAEVNSVQRTTKISTTKEFKYQYLDEYGIPAQGSTTLTFKVKACNDAHLAIRTPEIDPMEIVIGGWENSRSCIRIISMGDCLSINVGGVLSCDEYRVFTLDWKGREGRQVTLSLGNGTSENSKTILSLPLKFRLFNVSIGISTGYGSSGKWLFQDVFQRAIAEMAAPEKEVLTTKALIIIITGVALTVLAIVAATIGILLCLRYKRNREPRTNIENSQYIVSTETDGQVEHDYAKLTEFSNTIEPIEHDYLSLS
uniref:Uncharacterized protein LOC111101332 isoform X1 n=1 Tax=Crassostrea virginica TaxID=6565 RepID=A0A8B8ADD7_CRAVI|nr:uncharacterized protein LOC111101332 isoform X1 [Crassostrea virginica]XP_022289493.1 uncharacterized protein LOC111101332 isoform X2 [Crassostrea virginica]